MSTRPNKGAMNLLAVILSEAKNISNRRTGILACQVPDRNVWPTIILRYVQVLLGHRLENLCYKIILRCAQDDKVV